MAEHLVLEIPSAAKVVILGPIGKDDAVRRIAELRCSHDSGDGDGGKGNSKDFFLLDDFRPDGLTAEAMQRPPHAALVVAVLFVVSRPTTAIPEDEACKVERDDECKVD